MFGNFGVPNSKRAHFMATIVKKRECRTVPHPMLSMKFYGSFWKSKSDPYHYSLKFVSDSDTNYVSY